MHWQCCLSWEKSQRPWHRVMLLLRIQELCKRYVQRMPSHLDWISAWGGVCEAAVILERETRFHRTFYAIKWQCKGNVGKSASLNWAKSPRRIAVAPKFLVPKRDPSPFRHDQLSCRQFPFAIAFSPPLSNLPQYPTSCSSGSTLSNTSLRMLCCEFVHAAVLVVRASSRRAKFECPNMNIQNYDIAQSPYSYQSCKAPLTDCIPGWNRSGNLQQEYLLRVPLSLM